MALNARRATEEAAGQVRWLRPEYQAPAAAPGRQGLLLDTPEAAAGVVLPTALRTWPQTLPEQATALRELLSGLSAPADVAALTAAFAGRATPKRRQEIERLLATLAALGQAEEVAPGRWQR